MDKILAKSLGVSFLIFNALNLFLRDFSNSYSYSMTFKQSLTVAFFLSSKYSLPSRSFIILFTSSFEKILRFTNTSISGSIPSNYSRILSPILIQSLPSMQNLFFFLFHLFLIAFTSLSTFSPLKFVSLIYLHSLFYLLPISLLYFHHLKSLQTAKNVQHILLRITIQILSYFLCISPHIATQITPQLFTNLKIEIIE